MHVLPLLIMLVVGFATGSLFEDSRDRWSVILLVVLAYVSGFIRGML